MAYIKKGSLFLKFKIDYNIFFRAIVKFYKYIAKSAIVNAMV